MSLPSEDSAQRRLDELLDAAAHTDFAADLERTRAGTYTGRDRGNLVTAVVDGDGMVARIRFGTTTSTRSPELVAAAILDAVATARRQLDTAVMRLVARIDAQRLELEHALASMQSVVDMSTSEHTRRVWDDVRI